MRLKASSWTCFWIKYRWKQSKKNLYDASWKPVDCALVSFLCGNAARQQLSAPFHRQPPQLHQLLLRHTHNQSRLSLLHSTRCMRETCTCPAFVSVLLWNGTKWGPWLERNDLAECDMISNYFIWMYLGTNFTCNQNPKLYVCKIYIDVCVCVHPAVTCGQIWAMFLCMTFATQLQWPPVSAASNEFISITQYIKYVFRKFEGLKLIYSSSCSGAGEDWSQGPLCKDVLLEP